MEQTISIIAITIAIFTKEIIKINEEEKNKEEYSRDVKYDYSDLFKKSNKEVEKEEKSLIVVYKEGIFKRIFNKIKSIFKKS